ncbi:MULTISPECIES: alpha/beta fold hydrolase [unclassified Hahella]|uniref:alpha/beta fold hydrolase n=1 Tax=unclassified Hahella TaxID=2624107 RepID=UPI001C1EEA42|nr:MULTISPECIES: alpha/beta hydrolase [unclassified Hahella]MBU6951164.1 alpha/beta fold hydrolase [Hahella sp. HN01]MDG9666896.1 alpha/beta fold hydrolase [Hahella sp. CR1]
MTHAYYHPREQYLKVNSIQICYEELGDPDGEPMLLIMGLACQMTAWPPEFLEPLVEAGYRLIRLDNRDIGHSSEIECPHRVPVPVDFVRSKLGLPVTASYTLYDMADDAIALLDALKVERAHLVGVSMGGMISQIVAARQPQRIKSLTLMMTSNNSPKQPMPDLGTLWRINGGGVRGHHQEAALRRGVAFWETVQSPSFPTPKERILQRIARDYQRSYRPKGIVRQMRAILATGSLEKLARSITMPTLILHGSADPLMKPKNGQMLKQSIAHARLEMIPGWGHDLPLPLLPKLAQKVIEHARSVG